MRPRHDRWPTYEDAKPKEDKPKQSWDDWRKSYTREGSWQVRLAESHDNEGYIGDAAISVAPSCSGSDDGIEADDVGAERPQAGQEHARLLREQLVGHVTRAEKIKGTVYGEKATEERWNRRLVMSTDNQVLEVAPMAKWWTSRRP